MAKQKNTSLVPVAKHLPATRPAQTSGHSFSLYDGERHFTDREDVREFLPDILGRRLPAPGLMPIFVLSLITIHAAR